MAKVFVDPMISILKLDGDDNGSLTGKGSGMGTAGPTTSDDPTGKPDGYVDFNWWMEHFPDSNWSEYEEWMTEIGCYDDIDWTEAP